MCDRRVVVAVLMLVVLLTAAWGDSDPEPAAKTPEAVFKAWQAAIVEKDHAAYFDLLCRELREVFGRMQKQGRSPGRERERMLERLAVTADEFDAMSLREFAAKNLARLDAVIARRYGDLAARIRLAKLRGEPEIEGDKCRLVFSTAEDGDPVRMTLRHENGRWRIYEKAPFETAMLADPKARRAKNQARNRVTCMNNLSMIGGLLVVRSVSDSFDESLSGPAFLLQVATDISDEDLNIFICPGEPKDAAPDRPAVGSPEFVKQFRELTPEKLREDRDWSNYTSYAGPNFKEFPRSKRGSTARLPRLWACDRAKDGKPHHDGIVVLYASSKIDFLKLSNLQDVPGPLIPVGPHSPNELLKKMIFGQVGD